MLEWSGERRTHWHQMCVHIKRPLGDPSRLALSALVLFSFPPFSGLPSTGEWADVTHYSSERRGGHREGSHSKPADADPPLSSSSPSPSPAPHSLARLMGFGRGQKEGRVGGGREEGVGGGGGRDRGRGGRGGREREVQKEGWREREGRKGQSGWSWDMCQHPDFIIIIIIIIVVFVVFLIFIMVGVKARARMLCSLISASRLGPKPITPRTARRSTCRALTRESGPTLGL